MLKTVEKYNGWANRATWAVSLYIANDEGLLHTAMELIPTYCAGELETEYAIALEQWWYDFEQQLIDTPLELTRDMRALLWDVGDSRDVDWREIAEHLLDDEV